MAKKKEENKPKLKLVKNDFVEPTMEDIVHAVDKIIIEEDMITDEGLLRAFVRNQLKAICENSESESEEFEITVNTSSKQMLFDARPLDDFMIHSENLDDGLWTWVVSVQFNDEESNRPYAIIATADSQQQALSYCQRRLVELFEPYPSDFEELKILVKKEYTPIDEGYEIVKVNARVELYIEKLNVTYRMSTEIYTPPK